MAVPRGLGPERPLGQLGVRPAPWDLVPPASNGLCPGRPVAESVTIRVQRWALWPEPLPGTQGSLKGGASGRCFSGGTLGPGALETQAHPQPLVVTEETEMCLSAALGLHSLT